MNIIDWFLQEDMGTAVVGPAGGPATGNNSAAVTSIESPAKPATMPRKRTKKDRGLLTQGGSK